MVEKNDSERPLLDTLDKQSRHTDYILLIASENGAVLDL